MNEHSRQWRSVAIDLTTFLSAVLLASVLPGTAFDRVVLTGYAVGFVALACLGGITALVLYRQGQPGKACFSAITALFSAGMTLMCLSLA